jgi:hypothetical protein
MAGDLSCNVGKRIGRIGNRDKHGLPSSTYDFWNNIAIDCCVLLQKPQSPLRIAPVSCATGFFV